MEDFEFQNKGRILFGEGKRDAFLQGVKALSDKVLVVCGPHFARSGELGEMLTAFEEIGIRTWAIADLHQSTIEHARVAWKLCRDNEIGAVVGVGGLRETHGLRRLPGGGHLAADRKAFKHYDRKAPWSCHRADLPVLWF